ncbi:helix-turn-helix domain-containing protein [Streptomyces kronopolitis]
MRPGVDLYRPIRCPTGYPSAAGLSELAIRSARLRRDLTQEQLAEKSGRLDRNAITHIENGHMTPILDHLLLIAAALDVPLSALVRDS